MDDPGIIYFIQMGESGPIKIGATTSIESRLSGLQTGNPEKLRVLLTMDTVKMKESEANLHSRFRYQRLEGEWFKPDDFLLESIKILKEGGWAPYNDIVFNEMMGAGTAWADIAEYYEGFKAVMRKYKAKGDYRSMNYIMSEINELIGDIKNGHY